MTIFSFNFVARSIVVQKYNSIACSSFQENLKHFILFILNFIKIQKEIYKA